MTVRVADVRANLNENIRHAARIIGRSKARLAVFAAIYRGKKQVKTVDDLMKATRLSQVRVLQEGGKLAANEIVEQVEVKGRVAYKKHRIYSHHKDKVLDIVRHPEKKGRYPTKQEPKTAGQIVYKISMGRSNPLPQALTIDEIESFEKVKEHLRVSRQHRLSDVPEIRIKRFLMRVLAETHDFKDWGGEKNDLYTNKFRFRGSRRTAAFAIKGRATSGPLTPKKMGKNGDQIGRLFTSEAQFFFVVYHGKVDQSIHELLRAHGVARALTGSRVYYCVVDGDDLARLVTAYASEFKAAGRA